MCQRFSFSYGWWCHDSHPGVQMKQPNLFSWNNMWPHACVSQLSDPRSSKRDSTHAVYWVHLHPRCFLHPLHFGAATLMWVKVMWLSIVEYMRVEMSLGFFQTGPMLSSFDPSINCWFRLQGESALLWDDFRKICPKITVIRIFYLQNEDNFYDGGESELGNEDSGSSCVRGPPGPAGPPGPQVGSQILFIPILLYISGVIVIILLL